jgi:hypothetical protein
LARWTKADSIHLFLEGIAIVTMLTIGFFLILWTSPNDQGSINNAVLQGEQGWVNLGNVTCCNHVDGPSTVVIRASSEAQYTIEFQTTAVPAWQQVVYSSPNGQTYIWRHVLWSPPSSTTLSYEKRYVFFIYSFSALCYVSQQTPPNGRCAPALWFSGPHGNLSQSVSTSKYGSTDVFHGGFYGTSIIDVDSPGNYTLHSLNSCPCPGSNVTGTVFMGPSLVAFTRPYFDAGVATALIAGAFSVVTGFVSWRRLRYRPQTAEV